MRLKEYAEVRNQIQFQSEISDAQTAQVVVEKCRVGGKLTCYLMDFLDFYFGQMTSHGYFDVVDVESGVALAAA